MTSLERRRISRRDKQVHVFTNWLNRQLESIGHAPIEEELCFCFKVPSPSTSFIHVWIRLELLDSLKHDSPERMAPFSLRSILLWWAGESLPSRRAHTRQYVAPTSTSASDASSRQSRVCRPGTSALRCPLCDSSSFFSLCVSLLLASAVW